MKSKKPTELCAWLLLVLAPLALVGVGFVGNYWLPRVHAAVMLPDPIPESTTEEQAIESAFSLPSVEGEEFLTAEEQAALDALLDGLGDLAGIIDLGRTPESELEPIDLFAAFAPLRMERPTGQWWYDDMGRRDPFYPLVIPTETPTRTPTTPPSPTPTPSPAWVEGPDGPYTIDTPTPTATLTPTYTPVPRPPIELQAVYVSNVNRVAVAKAGTEQSGMLLEIGDEIRGAVVKDIQSHSMTVEYYGVEFTYYTREEEDALFR